MAIKKEIICLAAFLVVGIVLMCILYPRTEGMIPSAKKSATTLKKLRKVLKLKPKKTEGYQSGSSCRKN